MCFSATASFTAGTILSIAGGVTLKKAKQKSDLPFASIPLLFGIQQLIEGVVWISFANPTINSVAAYAFAIFSHVFWPIFIPIAVYMMEKDPVRKRVLKIMSAIGLATGIFLFFTMVQGSVTCQIMGNSIGYIMQYPLRELVIPMYALATCGSCFFSSHRMVNLFGLGVFVFAFIAFMTFQTTFASVWCFFAAVLSLIIYRHFHSPKKRA